MDYDYIVNIKRMSIHVASKQGRRPQNEDKHSMEINIDNKKPDKAPINFYGLYDGHGGKLVSEYLCEHLYKFFTNKKVQYPLTDAYIRGVFQHVQAKLKIKHPIATKTSGSTCLIVVQYKVAGVDSIIVINTGDSRCILCRDNLAIPLTKDHKPSNPEESKRIQKLGGLITFDGFDYRIKDLSVSRAFGDFDAHPYVTCEPETTRFKPTKKDKFIVLACDGLWDVLSNEAVVNFVLTNCYDLSGKRINKNINIAKNLAELGLQKGSGDNISVIVVFL